MRGVFRMFVAVAASASVLAQPAAPSKSGAAATPPGGVTSDTDELFKLGKELFEQYAPAEVKAQYEFPTKEKWDEFFLRLQRALEGESLDELAVYAPEARAALTALRLVPEYEDLADWLEQRLDEIEGAAQAVTPSPQPNQPPKTPSQPPKNAPTRPGTPPKSSPVPPKSSPAQPGSSGDAGAIPHYDLWLARVRERPVPARAMSLLPTLRAAFIAEGVPAELAWLAEAESSFNPAARSPVGAKGLFQFMPDTARSLGLSTFLPDDRTNPEKSARAAARYLKTLHGKFRSWPLALAAYNAGEGRVSRTLAAKGAKDFAGIAAALPAETRMYVPKVCALIATRAGVPPEKLAAPRG